MTRRIVTALRSSATILLTDSITEIRPHDAGAIVVSGSHGGSSAVAYAVAVPLKGCFFNDAGIRKDAAGISGLDLLACPAAAYGHASARIGDAADAWANGLLTALNDAARLAGLELGISLQEAVSRLVQD